MGTLNHQKVTERQGTMSNNEVLESVKQVLLSDEFLEALAVKLMQIEIEVLPTPRVDPFKPGPWELPIGPYCKMTLTRKETT
jgi:hypothetical protein